MKFAICNEIFKGWDFGRTCRFVRAAGYDALEIAPFTLGKPIAEISAVERSGLRRAAEEAGLAVSALHWVLAHTEGLHLTHSDAETRRRTAAYFCELVRLCDDLGGRFIVVGSPKQRNLIEGVEFEQGRKFALETFAPSLRLAEEKGVTFCFEPLSPSETNFINTAREAVRFAQNSGSPALKIILDVKAMASEGRPIPEIIAETGPHFAYFHANDPNLKGPGFGAMDFRPILEALRKVDYRDYVSVEVFNFDDGPEAIAERSIAYLRRCLDPKG
jgi:sugar phosphate isomerase/epimerase